MDINKFLDSATKRKYKSSQISESNIEKAFCNFAEKNKCKALKLIHINKKGFPDRTVICPKGRVFFIEFKRLGNKQSHTQKLTQKLLESLGFEYYVCDKIGQAESILRDFLEW